MIHHSIATNLSNKILSSDLLSSWSRISFFVDHSGKSWAEVIFRHGMAYVLLMTVVFFNVFTLFLSLYIYIFVCLMTIFLMSFIYIYNCLFPTVSLWSSPIFSDTPCCENPNARCHLGPAEEVTRGGDAFDALVPGLIPVGCMTSHDHG